MSEPHAHCVTRGHVAWITLDRPDVLNAMDLRMHEDLGRIWAEVEADDEVRLAVLTGAGERAFSVGQDLRERADLDRAGVERTGLGSRGLPGWPRLTDRFDLTKPVIARVDGYALGGGFELALACDLIIASDRSVFGLPEARLGLVPGAGGAFRLSRQLPLKTAMGYLLTGRRMDAATALGHGLVNEVVPAAELDRCVRNWVDELLECAPLSLRAIKQVVTQSLDRPLEEAFTRHYEYDELRRDSQDAVEGPRAFAERRPPRWTGRRADRHATTEEPTTTTGVTRADLEVHDLHPGLADPVLDSMNFLNEVTFRYPEAISFAPGRPYDGFFDVEQVFTGMRGYLNHLAGAGRTPEQIRSELFQYGPAAGSIRGVLARWLLTDEGIDVPPEAIVVTVGCQEAIVLALRGLIRGPEDALLVSSPCYVGITGAARLLDIEPVPVAEREDGLHVADLAAVVEAQRALGRRPRAFYLVPDHTNPSGMTLPLDARRELLDLAEELDLLILEDSPYRLVGASTRLPSLKALDRSRRVVHLGSFSKTLFPGTRVGFAIADQTVRSTGGERLGLLADELAKIKSMITVNTSALSQAAVAGMLLAGGGSLAEITREPSAHYGDSMAYMLDRLDAAFPAERRERLGLRWNRPDGGFFLAMNVAFVADNAALARSAERYGVLWTPMYYFYPGGGGERALRLSISYLSRAQIADGVERLARFIAAPE